MSKENITYQESINFNSSQNDKHEEALQFALTRFTTEAGDLLLSDETKQLKVDQLAKELDIIERNLTWKLDLCVTLPLFYLYLIANLNRSNFGLLYFEGISSSLKISQFQYICSLATYFAPYVLFQSFSNFTLKFVRPHFWIGFSVFIYGATVIGTGFAKNYGALLGCQFIHGLFQAGSDTAMIFILSAYYVRNESQKRVSIVFSASCLAVLLNNMICYGINLRGESSLETWRWMLICNGIITMCSSIILFLVIPDFPEGNRFLQDKETYFIIKKLEIFNGKSGYHLELTKESFLQQLKDPMIWFPMIPSLFLGGICYAYAFLEPLIFGIFYRNLGVLKSSWPWLTGFGTLIIYGYLCDYWKNHFVVLAFNMICYLYAILVLCFNKTTSLMTPAGLWKYSAMYFIVFGAYSTYPIFAGWATFNLNGHLRKSIATTLMVCSFDLGGLYGLFSLTHNDYLYSQGTYTALGSALCSVIAILCYLLLVFVQNKRKRTAIYKADFEHLSEREKLLAGDRNPDFDYSY